MHRTCLALVCFSVCGNLALAKAPDLAGDFSNKLVTFDEVTAEIRKSVESGDWKTEVWKPHATKTWLDHLLAEIKRATKREKLKLPVEFNKVRPANPEQMQLTQQNMLHVVRDGKISYARQCIILADGSVEMSLAEGCIIIARGAVTVTSSQRNLIVAGQYVNISSDRNNGARIAPVVVGPNGPIPPAAPAAAEANEGSVILCGGILDLTSAYGTICCGLERLLISYADPNVVLLNSPQREISSSARCESIDAPQVPFTRKAAKNPLEDKLSITQVVPGTTAGLVVAERNGVEYVLRPGAAITDERGQPIAGLENWKLDFLGRYYAQFVKDRQYASFYVKR